MKDTLDHWLVDVSKMLMTFVDHGVNNTRKPTTETEDKASDCGGAAVLDHWPVATSKKTAAAAPALSDPKKNALELDEAAARGPRSTGRVAVVHCPFAASKMSTIADGTAPLAPVISPPANSAFESTAVAASEERATDKAAIVHALLTVSNMSTTAESV